MTTSPLVTFTDVAYAYPGRDSPALRIPEWRVEPGEFITLTGPSGSGKSTLLRCLNGLTPHFSGGEFGGVVMVSGQDTRYHAPRDLARTTGFVFQDPEVQIVSTRVADELAFGMEQLGVPPPIMRKRVEEVLDLLGIAALRYREINTLSGGERQRVAVASALALQPGILALDEPTSQLDPWGAEEVIAALSLLNDDLGLTIVLAEHRLDRVIGQSDRLTLLGPGGVIEHEGSPRDVLAGAGPSNLPPLLALGRARRWTPLPLTIKEGRARVREETSAGFVPLAPGPDAPRPGGTPVLQVEGVSASWESRRVLREVTFDLYPGEVLALMGRNGSGKSTLLRVISGLHRPAGGRVRLRGQDTSRLHPSDIAQTVGYLPQNPSSLFFAETVAEELAFTLKHQAGPTRDPRAVLELLGLTHVTLRHPRDLSGGERERAALAAVLVGAPQVLLLDEPTRGMDATRRRQLLHLLRQLQGEGVAIILATHDVELVAESASRVAMLGDGQIVAEGTPREVLAGSLAFTTAVNKLYGGRFLTPQDVLGNLSAFEDDASPGWLS